MSDVRCSGSRPQGGSSQPAYRPVRRYPQPPERPQKLLLGGFDDGHRWGVGISHLSYLDVLVDGPFVEAKKNLSLRFRGSENQRIIDVPASLASGTVVLWQDWQSQGKGI